MTETPSNKKGFLGNLDQTIQDTQAKTVDFFDNAFGGDKRTLEEIKENRQKIRDKGKAKRKEIDTDLKKTKASKVIRGTISGPLKAINETVEFVDDIYDYAAGNPYDNNEIIDLKALGLEVQGDKEDWTYTLPQAVSQFLLPQGLIGKGLKATKLAGMNNAWTRNALAGFITDAVVQDPFEENLFNMIDKHPGLASPISELLKSKTEDEISVAEARLRQAGGGFIAGEALTVLGLGIKGIKKVPDVFERITKRLSRRDEILMTDDVVDNLGDEIIDLNLPNKVTKGGQKVETTFNTKTNTKGKYYKTETLTGGGDEGAAKLIIDRATKLRDLDANNSWPYKRTFGDMVDNANKLLPRETVEAAVRFNARYGRGGEEDLPAVLISMNQLMNENAIKLARLSKTMDESLASGNLEGLKNIKADFIKEAEVLDGLILLNKPLKTIPAQTLAANRAAGGVSRAGATIQDLRGRTPTEKAIDQATNLRSVVKEGEDPLPQFSIKEIIDLAEKGDKKSLKQLRVITKRLQAAKGNPAALQKMGKYDAISRVSSAVLKGQNEIFINSILSGPETHAVNILSTALNSVARPLEQTLGSAVTGDLTGSLRGAKELYYLGQSISESLKAAKLAFEIEDNIINPGAMIQDADRFTIRMEGDSALASMVNFLGTAIRLPSRFLLAEDEFFKSLNFRSYVKATAWEDGVRKGLKGQDLTDHIQRQFDGTIEIVNTNSFKNVKDKQITELYEKAQDYAAETTFTKSLDPDGVAGLVQRLGANPVGRIFLPFVRTPVNIFKAQARRTPGLNIFIEEYRQALRSPDPSIAAKARGEFVTGSLLWGTAAVVAMGQNNPLSELTITGGGPSNFELLNQKRATGWQPYSFRFLLKDKDGNVRMGKDGKPRYKYVSYKRLDPWSSFLMMVADGSAIMGGLTKQDRDDWAVAAGVALGRNITNKTYLQGITELSDLLQKPYKLQQWLSRRAASTVNPYSALGRSVKKFGLKTPVANEPFGQMIEGDRRIYDKKVRAGDDGMVILKKFWNELAATVPGYNNNLRPMRNWVTGSFIEYPAGYGSDNMDILNPIKETNSVNNTVLTTLSELGAKITQPSDNLSLGQLPSGQPIDSGIKLTYDEHLDLIEETAFVKINGVTMVQSLNKIIKTPQFQQLMKQARGEYITQTNMDVSVGASEYARASAEDALRDEINKYKKAGKKVWLDKNPQRAIEYNKAQAAIKQQASMDFLNSDLFEIKSSVPSN
tara:strand:+ start:1886 stop:5608 length:3723 start_codon:yes stop_codon:yes gene_type:complete